MAFFSSKWAAVNTQPHREALAIEHLQRQNFECYCPMVRKSVRHARKQHEVLRPLFPGYLFVAIDPDIHRWRPILSTIGVRTLVRCGERLAMLGAEFIDALKARELDMRERLTDAQVKQIMAQAVQTGVQAAFSAMQGGAQVAQMPMIAPIADEIMRSAGYQRPSPGGDDPNFPIPPAGLAPADAAPEVQQNTSPTFPPRAESGMRGIETASPADNLEGAAQ